MSPARRRPPPKRTRASGPRARPAVEANFWGANTSFDDPLDALGAIAVADDPAVVVRSLGAVPLAGREAHAERYFAAVYDKAAALAAALAATVDLLQRPDPDPE